MKLFNCLIAFKKGLKSALAALPSDVMVIGVIVTMVLSTCYGLIVCVFELYVVFCVDEPKVIENEQTTAEVASVKATKTSAQKYATPRHSIQSIHDIPIWFFISYTTNTFPEFLSDAMSLEIDTFLESTMMCLDSKDSVVW